MRQREVLQRKETLIKNEVEKKDQIKTITKELLAKLNESYGVAGQTDEDQLSQISRDSETSSVADEKEIHQKLQQILQILNKQGSEVPEESKEQLQSSIELNEVLI